DRAFIRNGWQKRILRLAATGAIPASIQWRADKVGYAAPLDEWMRGPLRKWIWERTFHGPVLEVPGYDRTGLLELWDAHQSRRGEHSWAIWKWLSLNEWLTSFIPATSTRASAARPVVADVG